MQEREREVPMSEDDDGSSKLAFFVAGMGIGAILALLFAPRSGQETRDYIAEKAGEGKDYMNTKGKVLRRQAEELVEKSKDLVSKQKEILSAALEAGKQAYQDEKAKAR
jgi:gas vesicle protein